MRPEARVAALTAIALLAGCGGDRATPTRDTTAPAQQALPAPAAPAVLSPTGPGAPPSGEAFGGIRCESEEYTGQHVHPILVIVIRGQRVPVPAGIGINVARKCLYWLHTHVGDGVLHVEAPDRGRVFRLGEFFALWGYPIGPDQLFDRRGAVYAFVDGEAVTGDPARIELRDAQTIMLTDQATLPSPAVPVPATTGLPIA